MSAKVTVIFLFLMEKRDTKAAFNLYILHTKIAQITKAFIKRGLYYRTDSILGRKQFIVGEPKSPIVQKHTFFAPERYTAVILYTECQNSV